MADEAIVTMTDGTQFTTDDYEITKRRSDGYVLRVMVHGHAEFSRSTTDGKLVRRNAHKSDATLTLPEGSN